VTRWNPAAALCAALALGAAPLAAQTHGALLEKSVDVPRDRQVTVDIPYEKATITTVESINDPDAKDLRDAKENPKDTTFLLIRFHYKNDDYVKHKVKLRAVLLDEKDGVLGEGGRTGTMDPQQTDDTLTFPMKIKTLDWPNAAKMKVIATFLN
jgi:hypothetical protein